MESMPNLWSKNREDYVRIIAYSHLKPTKRLPIHCKKLFAEGGQIFVELFAEGGQISIELFAEGGQIFEEEKNICRGWPKEEWGDELCTATGFVLTFTGKGY